MEILMNTTTDGLSLPNTPYTSRAVYLTPSNGFGSQLPKVPSHIFITERDQAFNPATGTAIINLDLSDKLKTAYPATTPNLLARYVRVKAGETQCLNLTTAGDTPDTRPHLESPSFRSTMPFHISCKYGRMINMLVLQVAGKVKAELFSG